ncbi:hypothetical protein BWI97_13820 [Siphonobacter sp. BAB-5405]|nr:hypothetical protein BWI97_13820 [Siphonobacter sp. BAB-5405]
MELDYEAYIYAGGHQKGGAGSNGSANTIANSKVSVPQFWWKVVSSLCLRARTILNALLVKRLKSLPFSFQTARMWLVPGGGDDN